MLRPQDERAAGAGAQNLLGGPEGVGAFGRFDVQQLVEREPDVIEAQAVWNMRRLYQRDGTIAQRTQCRPQQAHLTDTRHLNQQVDQRTDGPATAG